MIGRALNGRYELGEILGVGGMATVYRGVDRQLGRPVAVKVLNGGLADDPRFAERFTLEAQHAAILVHPRIVTVFDSGVDQGFPYIVMELVHGRPLSHLIAESGVLPVERAVGIASAVLEALEAAHGQDLVHRDIKPGNIMITADGGVKVVDFGIARAGSSAGNLTQTAAVVGTANYLSPEQATASALDGRADLYAVGCVLMEMLTGAPPFTADTPVAIAFKHVSEYPVPVSVRRPDIPPALDAAILRLLAKNPADRPNDAGRARAELLGAVPGGAAADRTSELLGAATQLLPPVTPPPGFPQAAPAQPYVENNRTSLLPSLPSMDRAEAYEDREPARDRNPMLLAGIGAAVLAVIVAVAAFALTGGGSQARKSPAAAPAASSAPAASAEPSASPSAAPSPTASASASPSAGAKANPAGQIAQLRAAVAQTDVHRERDRQEDLLRVLDEATRDVAARRNDAAADALKDAQRIVADLSKKRAVDKGTASAWQNKLGSLINTLRDGND
ncbi:protein kinase domain-containing protein [Kitasatospora camelliae]|uniref:non-specific serine/threonine protein kinase n=1 Tax=Kitasatospora camelliae TaxID=3156397 RepID=A0AAU8JX00_9ACTN